MVRSILAWVGGFVALGLLALVMFGLFGSLARERDFITGAPPAQSTPDEESGTGRASLTPSPTPSSPQPLQADKIQITGLVQLTTDGLVNVNDPSKDVRNMPVTRPWSPDSNNILFIKIETLQTKPTLKRAFELWTVSVNKTQRLLGQDVAEAAWSPDGKQIAFRLVPSTPSSASDIYVINSDGTSRRRLAAGDNTEGVSFLPDGNITFGKDGLVAIMTTQGTLVRQITNATPGRGGKGGFAFSPDGKRIAILSYPRLSVMNADGTGLSDLTNTSTSQLKDISWPISGRRLVYFNDFPRELRLVDAHGTTKVLFKGPDFAFASPSWTLDEQVILFGEGRNTPSGYQKNSYAVNVDGSGLTKILAGFFSNQISPGGNKLLVSDINNNIWFGSMIP